MSDAPAGGLDEFSNFRPPPPPASVSPLTTPDNPQFIVPFNPYAPIPSRLTPIPKPTAEEELIYSLLFPRRLTEEQQYQANRKFFSYILISIGIILFVAIISEVIMKGQINRCRSAHLNAMGIPNKKVTWQEKLHVFLNR